MKFSFMLRWTMLLVLLMGSVGLRGEIAAGEALEPELGIYVDIDQEKWGAAQVNLRIVDNNFQMFFLGEDKLLVEPPMPDSIVHYGNFIKDSNARFTVLLEKKGMMLTSPRVISPPHRYMVRIFLRKTVEPDEYYKEPYEVKEFIGMHTLNQLGGAELYEKSRTQPTSVPVPEEEKAKEDE